MPLVALGARVDERYFVVLGKERAKGKTVDRGKVGRRAGVGGARDLHPAREGPRRGPVVGGRGATDGGCLGTDLAREKDVPEGRPVVGG